MNNEVLEKIKQTLIQRKDEIEKNLSSFTENNAHDHDEHRAKFPDYGDKADENAQEITEYSTNLATERILENTLRDINAALDRIEKGTYGVCKYCGNEIGEKRLMARPVASACIECKTKLQKQV